MAFRRLLCVPLATARLFSRCASSDDCNNQRGLASATEESQEEGQEEEDTGCVLEGDDIGKEGATLRFDGVELTITYWEEQGPGEYVGFAVESNLGESLHFKVNHTGKAVEDVGTWYLDDS